ncbi:MAG: Uma2 family endonuclease [Hyphomicrobiaceae bacterium]|nr:Uma2 family endonuclease [Hyphomicrobiaceae bacterium]
MNTISRTIHAQPESPTEPFQRWRWTLQDLDRLTETGIIPEGRNVELIDGELIASSAKGNRHEMVRLALHDWFRRHLDREVAYYSEPGWRPDGSTYMEPDYLLTPSVPKPHLLSGREVLLVIEISDSTLSYDLKIKLPKYARLEVPEVWVIDAERLVTHVRREPAPAGYAFEATLHADQPLTPHAIPGLALRLADLGLEPADVT